MNRPRLVHDAAAGAPGAQPRLLLLSYHFPPALTAGALRWQKMLPLLAERGWSCDVIALDPEALDRPDWERLRELPPTTRVFGVRPGRSLVERIDTWRTRRPDPAPSSGAATPAAAGRASGDIAESLPPDEMGWTLSMSSLRRLYGTLLVHGREHAWASAAAAAGRTLAAETQYAAVITSGPPHSSHLAGVTISRDARIPLVTDFRDPWSVRRRLPEAYASPLYFHLAERGERRALARSSLAVATTDPIADALRKTGATCPVITVMNGLDAEEFPSPPRDRFVIAYAGALYLDRDPRPLFAAVATLVREAQVTPRELEVLLIGPVEQYAGRSTRALAEEAGIADYVTIREAVPRRELARVLSGASVLVSFPQDSLFAVPSKLFEYMAFEAWLLVLSGPGTPSATLMEGTDAVIVPPGSGQSEGIRAALGRWLALFRGGQRPTFLPQRQRFERRTQAAVLMDALEPFRPQVSR